MRNGDMLDAGESIEFRDDYVHYVDKCDPQCRSSTNRSKVPPRLYQLNYDTWTTES